MMRTDAGFHANQAWGHVGEPHLDLSAGQSQPQHNRAALVLADEVGHVLTNVDAECGNPCSDLAKQIGGGAILMPCRRGDRMKADCIV